MSAANFHKVWCGQRASEEVHEDPVPYCYKLVNGVQLRAIDGEKHDPKLWVTVTGAAHPDVLASGIREDDDAQFDGIELTVEKLVGKQWTEQKMRMSSDSARSLAATLIRAADIEQGLA